MSTTRVPRPTSLSRRLRPRSPPVTLDSDHMPDRRFALVSYTALALVAFAANSVLCRLALHDGAIDPASFSIVRFVSGAVMLLVITIGGQRQRLPLAGSWSTALILAIYALPF